MLILKRALEQCDIQQKELCRATGFSKTQVSLTLNTGKLPVDAEKFTDGVAALVDANPVLTEWLGVNNLIIEQLWQSVVDCQATLESTINIPARITSIIGASCLNDEIPRADFLNLARAALHLHRAIEMLAEDIQLLDINCEVNSILTEGRA